MRSRPIFLPRLCLLRSCRARRLTSIMLGVIVLPAGLIYGNVREAGQPIYTNTASVPVMPVAIVLGAGLNNQVMADRVATGVALYRADKVRKLLMTGDNGRLGYDEPSNMKALAVAEGVPPGDVVCDYAGFRTYDSLYRARDIFGVRQAVLVTQGYHLPRAMFLARHLGLTVVGIDAARHSYGSAQRWFSLREVAAVETAWFDVHIWHRRPKFLGKKEPLFS